LKKRDWGSNGREIDWFIPTTPIPIYANVNLYYQLKPKEIKKSSSKNAKTINK